MTLKSIAIPALDRAADKTRTETELRESALRKNARYLIPLLTLAFIFNYIDRTSVGFAAMTMNKDLGLTATQFGWGAGILFAGYCFFEIPSNLALYRFGARRWLARIMISWGLVAAATAFVTGPTSFYVLRFLLGVAEAGFFPGVAFFLSAWFPAHYRTRVLAWFMLGVPISSVIGGPMSSLLLQMQGILGLAGWQWMLLIEGLPACLIGFIVLAKLRDDPKEAHWLDPEERDALIRMLAEETHERPKKALFGALKDPRVLILAAIQFGFVMGSFGVGIWLPQILKGHGFTTLQVGFVSVIPYICAVFGMLAWARIVDRTGKKILNLLLTCVLGSCGLVFAAYFPAFLPAFIGLTVAIVAVSSARAVFWTIPTRFLTGVAAAGGLAFINSIGTMGGFFGPYIVGWLKDSTGSFVPGILVMAGMLVLSAVLSATLWIFVKKE